MAAAQSLEDVLSQVENLRGDFLAEIVVQEEESHTESRIIRESSGYDDPIGFQGGVYIYEETEQVQVIDQQRITKPDVQKQESARQGLQPIYDSSEWYSARYIAGKSLIIPREILHSNLLEWIQLLKKDICVGDYERSLIEVTKAEVVIQEEEAGHIEIQDPQGYSGINEDNYYREVYVEGQERIVKKVNPPEVIEHAEQELKKFEKPRVKARQDLAYLYDQYRFDLPKNERRMVGDILGFSLLSIVEDEISRLGDWNSLNKSDLELVYNLSKIKSRRVNAGKKLGYSGLTIFNDENPVIAGVLKVSIGTSMVAGLGYMLYQYFK